MFTRRLMTPALLIVVAALLILVGMAARPATASTEPPTAGLTKLLSDLAASGKSVTIEFAVPLVSGERTWIIPDTNRSRQMVQVGTDFVCFSEPWNNGTRNRCTPFSNIVSVSYIP
ncbi:MAG: hypothetical protein JNM70_06010 [Anaerolineae bacterium]|nr:hypothetical protein [Anaerolineae bacterium]